MFSLYSHTWLFLYFLDRRIPAFGCKIKQSKSASCKLHVHKPTATYSTYDVFMCMEFVTRKLSPVPIMCMYKAFSRKARKLVILLC